MLAIVNGSFEANSVTGDGWAVFDAGAVSGWNSLNGEPLEIWDSGHSGVPSFAGSNHLELDANGGASSIDAIYQDLSTDAGVTYNISFVMRSRGGNFNSSDEAVVVEWNGVATNSTGYRAAGSNQWTRHTVQVTGTGGTDRLLLRESQSSGANDGTGPLLDDVSFAPGDSVPPVSPIIVTGLNQPIAFATADDGTIFVTEKFGRVKVVQNGQITGTFIDLNQEINSHHDRGLMGIAIDPNFSQNGYVYLQYTVELNPGNPDEPNFDSAAGGRLIRVTAIQLANGSYVADLGSRFVIQDGHQMSHATHTVGDVDFDNQGNLIYTWGDGGFRSDLRNAAQDPNSRQGKLFRINRFTFQGVPGNPYYNPGNPGSIASRVWALGVRNSWKLTVDRPTGDVYMGEVTDGGPEEINVMRANGSTVLNYGWPYFEGNNRTSYGTPPGGFVYQPALVTLPHTNAGGGDSIVGGAVYRGTSPQYNGRYFFANFNQGIIYTADQNGNYNIFGSPGDYAGVVDIQFGPDGRMWLLNLFTGVLSRLDLGEIDNRNPVANASLSVTAGSPSLTVFADARSSFDPDNDSLSYSWDIGANGTIEAFGATANLTINQLGRTPIRMTVSDGNGGTSSTILEVDLSNNPDTANLAYGKPAVLSGVANGALASRAVDGNTNGNFGAGSVALSTQGLTPNWEVDLGSVQDIGDIEVYGRSDGGTGSNVSDYWVLVSDTPFNTFNLDAVRATPGVTSIRVDGTSSNLDTVAVDRTGRYVRVQMEDRAGTLALAEVRVLAPSAPVQTTIDVVANGTTGDEVFQLQVDQQTVGQWNASTVPATFRYESADVISADQIRVVFTNDLYDPAAGIDRDLVVDRILVNGAAFESEDGTTFSTGTWTAADGVAPGFGRGDTLHASGYFAYDQQPTGPANTIEIRAAGLSGAEQMQLLIDGVPVQTYPNVGGNAAAGIFQTYAYTYSGSVSASQVEVAFTNDSVGRDLRVDSIAIDGTTYQTESPNTYSTGTWTGSSCSPSFAVSEWLHCNGSFRYEFSAATTTIDVFAGGFTGSELMELQIDGVAVDQWTVNSGGDVGQTSRYRYDSNGAVSADQIRVAFVNDGPTADGNRDLLVDRIEVNGVAYESEAPETYSEGSWDSGTGCGGGFKASDVLHCDGYFAYGVGADGTAPIAAFSSPADGSTIAAGAGDSPGTSGRFAGVPVRLIGSASDNVAVDRVALTIIDRDTGYSWNGEEFVARRTRVPAEYRGGEWTYDLVAHEGGSFIAYARAWDTAGNLVEEVDRTRFYTEGSDTELPVTTIESPIHRSTVTSDVVTIAGTVSDNAAVDRMELTLRQTRTGEFWNGTAFQSDYIRLPVAFDADGNWQFEFQPLADGDYQAVVLSWDTSGNRAAVKRVRFFTAAASNPRTDNGRPLVRFDLLAGGAVWDSKPTIAQAVDWSLLRRKVDPLDHTEPFDQDDSDQETDQRRQWGLAVPAVFADSAW